MAFLGLLATAGMRLAKKKFSHKRAPPTSGLTAQESEDLGVEAEGQTFAGVPAEQAGFAPAQVPALVQPSLGVITTSPQFVLRGKCPRGYVFIVTGAPGMALHPGGQPRGTCVLTKVARALGLSRRRRGRGISGRDLRAALRVQRLVHHLAPKMGIRRSGRGHGVGCKCPRCK